METNASQREAFRIISTLYSDNGVSLSEPELDGIEKDLELLHPETYPRYIRLHQETINKRSGI